MTSMNVKRTKEVTRGKSPSIRGNGRVWASATLSQIIRKEYGLSQSLFAQLLGTSRASVARWEKTHKLPSEFQAKVRQVADLLKGLSRVIPKTDLAGWLTKPNDACRSAGGPTPANLMKQGQYDKIEAMTYFFESGVAY
jgi:DNA-binding transcriptional regulator YiaG